MRCRRQERRIRLDEDAVDRREYQRLANVLRVLERDRARERQEGPPVEALPRELRVAGEAGQDGGVRHAVLVKHLTHVVVTITVVDDQRLVEPVGHLYVCGERTPL